MTHAKVAFVTPGSFPIPSAKSSSVERVVEKFVPLLKNRIHPRIYGRTTKGLKGNGVVGGVDCVRFPAVNKASYIAAVGRSLAAYKPHVIQVENRPHNVLTLKKKLPAARIWLSLHSSTFLSPGHISPARLHQSLQAADRIIVNSEFLRRVVATRAPESAAKIRVVYPGVETELFPSRFTEEGRQKRERQRQAKKLVGREVVIFLGRLIPLKGAHHLLHIMPELVKKHPNMLAVIVGSPFYGSHRSTAYSRKLQQLGRAYPNHVRFVPYVPYTEVPGWFLAADMAIVPSGQREAFGLVNVEAMATGLPVVATRAGGMKEIVRDGVTGYLISQQNLESELKAKLHALLESSELRASMGKKSRERVERNFTWQHTGRSWMNVLNERKLFDLI
ncbi:glycosyltransferase family 4 protein [Paenibacillus sp. FSL H8-0537]|uniref:glycosyltransferase family 4 protein n=1 Tax=Paenibacillus sp. FSL H8-0537 TaxID=2921399 RepID=UPI0031014FEB